MILFMDVMTITRYVFIFWQKNPAIFQNAFWNWLINMWVICFSLLSQLVYAYLPGKLGKIILQIENAFQLQNLGLDTLIF